jgi:OmpA-OmpF porin, OOP family
MASMLDDLRELVSPATVSALSTRTGESEFAVSRGMSAAIPTIAAAIANRCDDHSFMKDLAVLATRNAIAPEPASDGDARSPATRDTAAATERWLSTLFGSNQSAVNDAIARHTGIRASSAAALVSAGAPFVLAYLGRVRKSEDLTVSDLADRLRDERAELVSAVPAGIELPEIGRAPIDAARTTMTDTARSIAARLRRDPTLAASMAPILGLIALIAVGGLIWRAGHKPAQQARVETTIEPMAKPVGTSGSFGGPLVRRLPGNVIVSFPFGGAEDRLSGYLASAVGGGTTVTVDRIGFQSGSATLTPESREQIGNLATILRAYPKATVMVAGYTDNVGNEQENVNLSKARAEVVARGLTAAGVPAERVRAEGFGSSRPIADNATEAGRQKNRRVTLDVSVR